MGEEIYKFCRNRGKI